MSRIAYQPCADTPSQANLIKTIHNPVSIERLSKFLDERDVEVLRRLYPDGRVYLWGVNGNQNALAAWRKLSPGDVAIFNTKKVFSISGVITHKVRNREAALDLWGVRDEKDQSTWECLYFLDQVTYLSKPYDEAFKGTEKKPRMSFNRMGENDSELVLQNTGLDGRLANVISPPSIDEARDEIRKSGETDGTSETKTRKEHAYIVQHLFENRTEANCSICGKLFPRTYLVAAHLKKRAKCETKEKLDIENIAGAMCTFGCDSLYENGFISVDNSGKVIAHPTKIQHEALEEYVGKIVGNPCSRFNDLTAKYFSWHRKEHGYEAIDSH